MKLAIVLSVLVCLNAPFENAEALGRRQAVSGPPSSGNPSPSLEHGELSIRVLSYNVKALSIPGAPTRHLAEIGRILKRRRIAGTAPQVVAIQEAFHWAVEDLIREAGYPYIKNGPGPSFGRTGSGLVILSEFPLHSMERIIFNHDNSAGFDWNANKGVVAVKVQLPGLATPVSLLDTHMQADYSDFTAPIKESIAARRRQIAEIGSFVSRPTLRNGPLIFVGDFNTNKTVGDYYDLVERTALVDSAENCLETRQCEANVDLDAEMDHSLDHQFYRSVPGVQITPRVYEKSFRELVNGKPLSDHDGLEVSYSITW